MQTSSDDKLDKCWSGQIVQPATALTVLNESLAPQGGVAHRHVQYAAYLYRRRRRCAGVGLTPTPSFQQVLFQSQIHRRF